jgi:hypothetical protein
MMARMRLTAAQQQTIRQVVAEVFGPDARLLLFGSRTDDDRRGGDFDFCVEVPGLSPEEIAERTVRARSRLYRSRAFRERKVDLVVCDRKSGQSRAICEVARRTGIPL